MNLLLDTHVWILSHADPARLTKRVAGVLTDQRNELWLSPISVWEFPLLAEHGRVRPKGGLLPRDWQRPCSHASRCTTQP